MIKFKQSSLKRKRRLGDVRTGDVVSLLTARGRLDASEPCMVLDPTDGYLSRLVDEYPGKGWVPLVSLKTGALSLISSSVTCDLYEASMVLDEQPNVVTCDPSPAQNATGL